MGADKKKEWTTVCEGAPRAYKLLELEVASEKHTRSGWWNGNSFVGARIKSHHVVKRWRPHRDP